MKTDVLVLGAGMVGVSAALALQARGRTVTLVDRRGAAEETSHGNAGVIQREAVLPYTFPRDPWVVLNYAFNRLPRKLTSTIATCRASRPGCGRTSATRRRSGSPPPPGAHGR